MSRFEERNLVRVGDPKCSSCKHCMISEIENNDGYAYSEQWTKVYNCMLDVSKEDIAFVEQEIEDYVNDPYRETFTDKFNQIMRMNPEYVNEQCVEDSARRVAPNNCCQFYERKRKEEKER